MSNIPEVIGRPVWDEATDAVRDPLFLRQMLDHSLLKFRDRLNLWEPDLGQHKGLRLQAKNRLFAEFETRGIDPDTPTVYQEFSPEETAERMMEECFVFTLILGQPSFAKRLPAQQVIDTLVGLGAANGSGRVEAPCISCGGSSGEAIHVASMLAGYHMYVAGTLAKVQAKTLAIRQELIAKDELDDFEANTRKMKEFLRGLSIPSRILAGQPRRYLMRVGDYERVMEEFKEFEERRREFVWETLQERWNAVIERAREERGEFFMEEDYKSYAEYAVRFKCDYWVEDLMVSEDLKGKNKEMYDKEMSRVRAECAAEAQFLRDTLRMQLQDLIDSMVEMVSPSQDGKQKRFSGARVSALKEFVTVLGDKDLNGDEQLALVAEKAAMMCDGIDPHSFRDDAGYRAGLQKKFEAVKAEAAKMVVVRSRKFNLGAED